MNPSELAQARDQHTEVVAPAPTGAHGSEAEGLSEQAGLARLNHLFRHASDAPENRFLLALITHYRKLPAA
jgi:hypothetical protein